MAVGRFSAKPLVHGASTTDYILYYTQYRLPRPVWRLPERSLTDFLDVYYLYKHT